jgi:competence protein ComEA
MKSLIVAVLALLMAVSVSVSMAANVNTDDAATIAKDLKGVGVKKAELIVAGRSDGDYKDGADLASRVKGIGDMTVEKNADMLDFGPSK